jgi:hypothetical protein
LPASTEHHRPLADHDQAMLDMPLHGPGEDNALDVATDGDKVANQAVAA